MEMEGFGEDEFGIFVFVCMEGWKGGSENIEVKERPSFSTSDYTLLAVEMINLMNRIAPLYINISA